VGDLRFFLSLRRDPGNLLTPGGFAPGDRMAPTARILLGFNGPTKVAPGYKAQSDHE
jgi:hypothetical protein